MAADDEMFLAFGGNTYLEHRVSQFRDPEFMATLELVRNADAFFINLEGCIIDGPEWPAFGSGMGWSGSYLGGEPWLADELKFLGVTAIYAANNHVADFGEQGILSTMKHLRARNIAFAGIGSSLAEAIEPCYVATAHGRVALLSAADWGPREKMDLPAPWPAGYLASNEEPWYQSRPGLNLLRYESVLNVDEQALAELRRISEAMDWEKAKASRLVGGNQGTQPLNRRSAGWEEDSAHRFHFMGRRFELGDRFGFSTLPYEEDLEQLLRKVREARRRADVVVVALHDQIHGDEVHDYVRMTAYQSIDAGADVFICTGGTPKGIEIYKGKAILHGQQEFCFQNSQVKHIPPSLLVRKGLDHGASAADFYQARQAHNERGEQASGLRRIFVAHREATIQAVILDQNCEVKEVRAYPIQTSRQGTRRSVPMRLSPDSEGFHRAIERVTRQSIEFGTDLRVRDGYGVVEVR
jgi:poly-gamma-glutamate capsule biosynthesis protein CapA/YwtB (metallophosphatase superfamily)